MKKAALVLITVILTIVLFASCNKNVCPAYVKENTNVQVKDNG